MLLTGCGTQVDPFAASPAAQAKADNDAEALSMALLACTIYEEPVTDNERARFEEFMRNAQDAAGVASEAAYLDPRWRTLADALPFVAQWADIQDKQLGLASDEELAPWALEEAVSIERYLRVVNAECAAAEELDKR